MYLSVAYYPEWVSEERWKEDIHLMSEADIQLVRVGEFAWCRMEKGSGRFDFSWLDKFFKILDEYKMKAILCTPTASPPPWLVEEHPDILPIHANRSKRLLGSRRHYCPNNPNFHKHTVDIVKAMGKHFCNSSTIFAWHLDNEFGCEIACCYCDTCKLKFQRWLKDKYKTLEELNKRWGTIFWSQEYSKWSQIELPLNPIGEKMVEVVPSFRNSPSLLLDFQRFCAQSYLQYQNLQIDVLRKQGVSHPISTNFVHSFSQHCLNYYKMAKNLDVTSIDYYFEPDLSDFRKASFTYDGARGIKGDNFYLMETTCGKRGVCWPRKAGPEPLPKIIRLATYQAFAHGADLINYFLWRPSFSGSEQYHGAILDHDGIPRRRYKEIKDLGKEWKRLRKELEGTKINNEVAILFSQDNLWADKTFPINSQFDYLSHLQQYHNVLREIGIGVNIIPYGRDISSYKLVIAPWCQLVNKEMVKYLEDYVFSGGTLITTIQAGAKNFDNLIISKTFPGRLRNLLGVEVEQYEGLPEGGKETISMKIGNREYKGKPLIWRDILKPIKAKAIVFYEDDYCQGKPAITKNIFGKGEAYYFGTVTDDTFTKEFLNIILKEKGIFPLLKADAKDLRVAKRGNFLFIFNPSQEKQLVTLSKEHQELITGKKIKGKIKIESRELMILKKEEKK